MRRRAERRKLLTISTMFTVTEAAATKVTRLLHDEDAHGMALRVAVRPGGCSGYSYELYFDGDFTDDDTRFEQHGLPVVIDPASLQLLTAATLDYKDGLNSTGLTIVNPGAQRTCGCGQSFS